jgi:hypothetical protein
MLDRLGELKNYMFYFQFTVTPYGQDMEPRLPAKSGILAAFKRLSDVVGADRVIWRYDPILISAKYPPAYHVRAFGKIAKELRDYTKKVTISFIDADYRGVKSNIKELALLDFPPSAQTGLSAQLAGIAQSCGLAIETCADATDRQMHGIGRARCIDGRLLAKLLNRPLKVGKDKNQRPECGCAASIDIGMYNTCLNGCRYCYANYNPQAVAANFARHDPGSPLLAGAVGEGDKIGERAAGSCRDPQTRLLGPTICQGLFYA